MACALAGPTAPGSPVNGARRCGRQPRASVASRVHRTLGRRPGWPEIGKLGLQALDLEPSTPPPENMRVTTPAGASVSANSTASRLSTASLPAGSTWRHLQQFTRSKRSAERQRRSSGLVPSAASQSKRLSADHQALFLRTPDDVGHLDQGILQMG